MKYLLSPLQALFQSLCRDYCQLTEEALPHSLACTRRGVCVCVYLCILLHGVLHGDVERRIVACEWNYHSREISLLSFETDHRPLEHPFLFSIAEWRHRGRSSFNDTLSSSVWISLSTVPQASGKLNKRNKIIHPSAPSLEWGTCRNKGN